MDEEKRKEENTGMVWLIGSGCGGKELLTLKAWECIKNCEVLIYDSLVDEGIVSIAPPCCEKIYVGKRYGSPSSLQTDINALIVQKAKEGKRTVRLKGGDPFVFGRGGEEAEYLIKENISFQIVPGISSCIAVPELAGIPVTHRDVSRSFHVVTARTSSGSPIDSETLRCFAVSGGTLVVLMGLSLSKYIAESLMGFGVRGDMPAAVISNGGGERQQVLRTCLKNLDFDIEKSGLTSPAVIVVGQTSACDFSGLSQGEKRDKSEDRESSGLITYEKDEKNKKGILITGSLRHTLKLEKLLKEYGLYARKINLTQIIIENDVDKYTKGIEKIKNGCYTIFTSPNGVDVFFKLLKKQGIDIRVMFGAKVAAVGSGTCERLKDYGIIPDIVPEKYTVEELAKAIVSDARSTEGALKTAVAFRSREGSDILGEILSADGFEFSDIKTYTAAPKKRASEEFLKFENGYRYSRITFSSGSGVRAFFKEFKKPMDIFADDAKIVCIGEETKKELEKYRSIIGNVMIVTAKRFSCEGLAEAVAISLGIKIAEQKET